MHTKNVVNIAVVDNQGVDNGGSTVESQETLNAFLSFLLVYTCPRAPLLSHESKTYQLGFGGVAYDPLV